MDMVQPARPFVYWTHSVFSTIMNVLYIDPIAGDMLCAALLDLGLDQEEWTTSLSLPLDNYRVTIKMHAQYIQRNTYEHHSKQILAKHEHEHHHHAEPWGHHHRGFSDVCSVITSSLPEKYNKCHCCLSGSWTSGSPNPWVHWMKFTFMKSVQPIPSRHCWFCLRIHMLRLEIYAAPPPLSYGHTHGAHGNILSQHCHLSCCAKKMFEKDFPITSRQRQPVPLFWTHCAKSSFPTAKLSPLDMVQGQEIEIIPISCVMLCTENLESKSPQSYVCKRILMIWLEKTPLLIERCLDAGALDVFAQPIIMKKDEWGILLPPSHEKKQQAVEEIFTNTSTFGIRYTTMKRTDRACQRTCDHSMGDRSCKSRQKR